MEIILHILGLAYFVFALWSLRWAVLLLPLFFPTYLLKFELFGVPFPLVEVFIYATFLAWILQCVMDLWRRKVRVRDLAAPFRNSLWIGVLGILVAGVISVLIAPQAVTMMDGNTIFYGRKIALGILKSWIVAPILMLVLFAWVIKTAKDKTLALNAYAVSAAFLALWGIYQALTGQYITADARASGPFNSANYLALYITPALFYVVLKLKNFVAIEHETWWKKLFHFLRRDQQQPSRFFYVLIAAVGFLLLFFGLLFTKSYAAFLAFFIAGLIWLAMQMKAWKKFPWKIITVVVVFILLVLLALIVLDPVKWQTFFQLTTRTSSGVRVEVYTIATQLLMSHPLQGIGLGMFPAVYQLEGPRILGHGLYELNMLHPHNVFLAFWLNLGLLGFLSFLWILKVCFHKFRKNFSDWFRMVGFFMLLILLIHGLVDTTFFKNDLSLLFWLVVSVIMFPL